MHVQKQSSDVIAHQWRLESAELICHLKILADKMSILYIAWTILIYLVYIWYDYIRNWLCSVL